MKVILLFDGLDGKYREYELNDELNLLLHNGNSVEIEFCDPKNGDETFRARRTSAL